MPIHYDIMTIIPWACVIGHWAGLRDKGTIII